MRFTDPRQGPHAPLRGAVRTGTSRPRWRAHLPLRRWGAAGTAGAVLAALTGSVLAGFGLSSPAAATGAGPTEYGFVTNATGGSVTVLDTSATPPTVVTTVNVGNTPQGVAVTPDDTQAFVANYNDGTVSVIDSGSNTVVDTITVGSNPTGIAISGDDAFVVNTGSNSVSVINTSTDAVVGTVSVGTNPTAIAVSDGHAWVTNYGGGTVTPLAVTSPFTVGTPITVPNPSSIAAVPGADEVLVTEAQSSKVAEINTATQTLGTLVTVGNGPDGIAVTPNGTTALVSNYSDGSVTEFSVSGSPDPVTTSLGTSTYPLGITTNAAGTEVFVVQTGTDNVTELSVGGLKNEGSVGAGDGAAQVADAPDAALSVPAQTLPAATIGQSYDAQLKATGGAGGYLWSKTAGTLPNGLSLSTSGLISGTPASTATSESGLVFKATDAKTDTATTATLSIAVAVVTVQSATLPNAVRSTVYTGATITAIGGTAPYKFSVSSGALPLGLGINATTGAISGTVSATAALGPDAFTIQATDAASHVGSQSFSILVAISAPSVATSSLPTALVGSTYPTTTLTATGGTGPYRWTVSAGLLPDGLSFSALGALSGTVESAGSFSVTFEVTDADGDTGSRALTIATAGVLAITTTSLPSGISGTAYDQSVATSGGETPLAFSVAAGALPAGLGLNTHTGAITGTPTAPGSATFTVKVVDSFLPTHQQAIAHLSITINRGLTVTTTSLPEATVGHAYHQTITTEDGTAPETFSVASGSLPPGLGIASTSGTISGTPTTAGTYTFTIKVLDSSTPNQTALSGSLTISVLASLPRLKIKTTSLADGAQTYAYDQTVETSGGVAPLVFSIGLGTLPVGLHIDATTGTITGTPSAAGTAYFTVTVHDAETPPENASALLSITVDRALAVTTTSLSGGTVGSAYSQTITTANGTAPLTFGIGSGSLPVGLGIDAITGAITGTPTTAGTSTFTVKVTDSSSPKETATSPSLTIKVSAASLQTGYDLVGADGGVFVLPTGQSGGFYGSLPGIGVTVHDIVGMVPSHDFKGYFLVGSDGGVFAFGDAAFEGSLPGINVAVSNIVGIVPSSDDKGYFLVGSDGGVFAFGDSTFEGSLPGNGISTTSVVGIASAPTNRGYWVVESSGAVYAFGTANFFGSASPSAPISGIAATPDGGGYWLVGQNGSVYAFGDAVDFGSLPGSGITPPLPVVGIVPTVDQKGYWLIGADGSVYPFGDATTNGDLPKLGVSVSDVVGGVPTIL